MSAQYHSGSQDGVKTYIDRNGDTVQESSGPVPVFRGLAAAGGEAFISDSEESSGEEYHQHGVPSLPKSEKKSKKEKKDKKSKKSKKERSGSSSSGHGCNCSHSH
ncbi:hypothetical protein TWF106_004622 [Orbilia oligospora]|uniref:Uncharacterized protein n=1 Tax=Orbilia oligospora TaxID=2813651 RepID=A0A6G1M7F3_ORBOL|nr:hypothetical protein TWF788_003098 [Orbilia oligospora]KAF3204573.1 hypothetical protein TWF679_009776 [Orbilia oligospora]KAF3210286.1 hypothetical protein TWF191_011243 [Orbilia oligospora]KAF3223974.1 hypothetical protein TWF106_004622 [Orbilia oligospora]KAF3246621.1 hypothetical protein TWF192_006779 [Orbilia oligospora]